MARIRLNQELRNKCGSRFKVHFEAEDTQEKKSYDDLKADQIEINDNAWTLAKKIVRQHYTPEDIVKARYLQDKFENVDTIQPDSCFHFHYTGMVETRDYDNNAKMFFNLFFFHFKIVVIISTLNHTHIMKMKTTIWLNIVNIFKLVLKIICF